ncbi:unnamed protein product, partial [Nesidiocoris tenuis]
ERLIPDVQNSRMIVHSSGSSLMNKIRDGCENKLNLLGRAAEGPGGEALAKSWAYFDFNDQRQTYLE